MKRLTLILIPFVLLSFNNNFSKSNTLENSNPLLQKINSRESEDFFSFLTQFSYDSVYQMSRIKFPLKSYGIRGEDFDRVEVTIYNNKQWKFIDLLENKEYHTQTYDNFECKMKDSNERVFAYEGNGCGVNVKYFFKRIDGKWFLIKIEDFST